MQRIEYLLIRIVTTRVTSNDLVFRDDFQTVHVGFDGDRRERITTRYAVAVLLPSDRLILVGFAHFADRCVKAPLGQGHGQDAFLSESSGDRFLLARDRALLILQAALAKMFVQRFQVLDLGHGGRPVALHEFDTAFHMRLLVAASRHATQRLEVVVAGQGQVLVVEFALPATQDGLGDRLGIIPPKFLGNTAKELEGQACTVGNGFDFFTG